LSAKEITLHSACPAKTDEIRFSSERAALPSNDENPVLPLPMQPTFNLHSVFDQFRSAVENKPKRLPVFCQGYETTGYKHRKESHENRDPLEQSPHPPC